MHLPTIKLPTIQQLTKLTGLLRDLAAVLFTPCLTLYAVGVTYIIWRGPWPEGSAETQLMYLGVALIASLFVIALGSFWLQRRSIPEFKVSGGPTGFNAEISEGDIADLNDAKDKIAGVVEGVKPDA